MDFYSARDAFVRVWNEPERLRTAIPTQYHGHAWAVLVLAMVAWLAYVYVHGVAPALERVRRRRMAALPVAFNTHFAQKVEEVGKIMGANRLRHVFYPELPTREDLPLHALASYRVRALRDRLARERHECRSCFIEEASLAVEGCSGYPGHGFREIVNRPAYFRQWAHHVAGRSAHIQLVVAYWDAVEQREHLFYASQRGKLRPPAVDDDVAWTASGGIGWDLIFAPDDLGGHTTIAQAIRSKHHVDVRPDLYLQFVSLVNPESPGTFETHLTLELPVDARDSVEGLQRAHERFRAACVAEGVRPLVVFECEPDDSNFQVQFQTARYDTFGSVRAASRAAVDLVHAFRTKHNLAVARTRVESTIFAKLVPETDADLKAGDSDRYFEFHRRLASSVARYHQIVDDGVKAWADATCIALRRTHGSRRGRAPRVEAHASRVGAKLFVNARFWNVGRDSALVLWGDGVERAVTDGLADDGEIEVPPVLWSKPPLREYTVMDDDPQLDSRPLGPCCVPPSVFDEYLASFKTAL